MAYLFGDSFDFYASIADMGNGYWDSSTTGTNAVLTTGRFTGSQAYGVGAIAGGTILLSKSSGSNDQTHHIVCAFEQAAGLANLISGLAFTFMDGSSSQCSIVFRTDGAILLTSGAGNGSTLATYTSAFTSNTWTAFEFEVTIDNTAGVFRVRKNGNTVNDFQATGLNTRAGSSNSYANKLQVSFTTNSAPLVLIGAQLCDDLLWFNTTGAAPNTWVGDVRAYPLIPTSDASVQFSQAPSPYSVVVNTGAASIGLLAGQPHALAVVPAASGHVTGGTIAINVSPTANIKLALYDPTRTSLLATSSVITNPGVGNASFTFSSPPSVTRGSTYYIAVDFDANVTFGGGSNTRFTATLAYASFPVADISGWSSGGGGTPAITLTMGSLTNSSLVSETLEDGATSYVYSSSLGASDLYNVAHLPGTPASIVAVTTRGYGQKSDAGTRIGEIQLKSGSTTTTTGPLPLATSFTWQSRTDITDPNTGLPWTASGVNTLQIGPLVAG